MNSKRQVFGAAAAAGVLALGSVGFAAAQATDDQPDHSDHSSTHGTMAGHEQMANHGGMTGHDSAEHTQMHEAMATALGLTVAELDAQLESGKTVADIAAEKGVDRAALHATMQGGHSGEHGTGMNHATMHGTN